MLNRPKVACFHSFCWPLGISVLSPHPIPNHVPLSTPHPIPFPSQVPPSPLMVAFFSLPSRTEASSHGPFGLLTFFEFCGLYLGYSVFCCCLANIYMLVNIYHACPFGFELPHSGSYFLVLSICRQNSECPRS